MRRSSCLFLPSFRHLLAGFIWHTLLPPRHFSYKTVSSLRVGSFESYSFMCFVRSCKVWGNVYKLLQRSWFRIKKPLNNSSNFKCPRFHRTFQARSFTGDRVAIGLSWNDHHSSLEISSWEKRCQNGSIAPKGSENASGKKEERGKFAVYVYSGSVLSFYCLWWFLFFPGGCVGYWVFSLFFFIADNSSRKLHCSQPEA